MMQQNQISSEAVPLPVYPMIPPVLPRPVFPQPISPPPAEPAEFVYPQPVVYLPKAQVWEYKTVVVPSDKCGVTQNKLDAMGKAGWELCNVLTLDSSICYYFKRRQFK